MDVQALVESTPRKRGRPRKADAPQKKSAKEKKNDIIEEDIIVHMAISAKDINDDKVNGFELIQTECNDIDISDGDITESEDEEDVEQLQRVILEKDKRIAFLEAKLKSQPRSNSDSQSGIVKYVNVYSLDAPFDKDKETGDLIIPEHTTCACLWDTYEINGTPVFLPEKYIDEKFHVVGWFCSLNCAVAYNLNMGDYNTSERHSLLKLMYGKTCDIINPAPSMRVLTKYGGKLSIEEYRKNLQTNDKEYRLISPPMTFIAQTLEEKISRVTSKESSTKRPNIIDEMYGKSKSKPKVV
jgi:hypothetical protein